MTGRWDQVLAFGQYQHATIDGEPVLTVFDASTCTQMLDDFAQHPESDIFYDKQHEIVEALGDDAMDRAALQKWGDGHALAWANALVMVVAGQVARYEAHAGAPAQPPSAESITRLANGQDRGDGVYALRCDVTPRGADPKNGLAAFRYTSPYFVPEKDGWRLLNLTATNDPRMRGAALAMGRDGRRIAMQRTAPGPMENKMPFDKEMMSRIGMEDGMSEAAKIEKMAAYIRKMEDEAKKAAEEKSEAMGRIQKMEADMSEMKRKMDVDPSNLAQNAAIHLKTGNVHDEGGRKAERMEAESKEAMQAMQRRLATLEEQNKLLSDTLKTQREAHDALAAQAMERQKKEQDAAAESFADRALANGQWNPMHAGGSGEKDPGKALAMTRAWLKGKYLAGQQDILLPEGTFKPSEAQVMQRVTSGGRVPGSPDPLDGATPSIDVRFDAAVAAEIRAARTAGQNINTAQAMHRVKTKSPDLHREWAQKSGRLA